MLQSPLAISNYFIKKSLDEGVEITPMKLLKLVYIAHGWKLGLTGESLLTEGVEAWKFGPVIPTVYEEFKKFGNGKINAAALDMGTMSYPLPQDEPTKQLLEKVWDVYKGYDGRQLSTLTHQKDSPWDIIWNGQSGKEKKSTPIPNDLIKDYYREKANQTEATNQLEALA